MSIQLISDKQTRKHTMGFLLKQLVSCLWSILFFLSTISFSNAKERPCKGPDLDQDPRRNYAMDDADFVFLFDNSELVLTRRSDLPERYANHTRVLSTINSWIHLWQDRPDGSSGVDEASFSVTVVYQPLLNRSQVTPSYGGIAFLIIPFETLQHLDQANDPLAEQLLASHNDVRLLQLSDPTSRIASVSGSYTVYVAIGMLGAVNNGGGARIVGVDVAIDPAATAAGAASSYTVWIDYDRVRMSVYIDVEGKPKPTSAIAVAPLNISGIVSQYVSFGLVSTAAQLISARGVDFSATVDVLLPYYPDKGGFMSRKVTLLSSVLGSVAATGVVAVAVACYFNSRYRRWQRDLDQLARSMERLPGVPTKIDFADINKATGNFHETMKLGGGGFGTVYRCTLPAAVSKTERPMDVAVKRFTRDVQNRRYEDFLAEVSIINRLRHKNIVPLIGWSYHKGEPLLVFEYMTNGSLDQHLFPKGRSSSIKGQRLSGATNLRWATRYEIVRDIVTGLHYVHHEYEPMVLHRDIKASNVMLDSSFHARFGDFGLACTVAVDRNSASGVAGTWGYIAPEYAMCGKATRQTDIYALGVLILEVVTGQPALVDHPPVVMDDDEEIHISDRVWRLYREGSLTECVDAVLIVASSPEEDEQLEAGGEAERLLLLGLSCSNPNPSDRPTMTDVVRVIAKSAPPPELPPHKPRFVWPPPEEGRSVNSYDGSTGTSMMSYLDKSTTSTGELQSHISVGQPAVEEHVTERHTSFQHSVYSLHSSE